MAVELLEQAISAQGGRSVWESAEEIRVGLSAGGLAFGSKLQGRAVRNVQASVSTSGQHVVFAPYPRPGQRGILLADGTVRIETDAGEVLESRAHAREAFAGLRHKLWWDRLDMLYFGTQALWTYMSAPFVFAREGYAVRELEPWTEGAERWRRLAVTFPEHVHTHSREQVFHFDGDGLLRRHDYTAEPIGGWATAAHYCEEHRTFDGLVVATHRRVYPRRRDNRRRVGPLLVWIELAEARSA
jgi:hypothetical protein